MSPTSRPTSPAASRRSSRLQKRRFRWTRPAATAVCRLRLGAIPSRSSRGQGPPTKAMPTANLWEAPWRRQRCAGWNRRTIELLRSRPRPPLQKQCPLRTCGRRLGGDSVVQVAVGREQPADAGPRPSATSGFHPFAATSRHSDYDAPASPSTAGRRSSRITLPAETATRIHPGAVRLIGVHAADSPQRGLLSDRRIPG